MNLRPRRHLPKACKHQGSSQRIFHWNLSEMSTAAKLSSRRQALEAILYYARNSRNTRLNFHETKKCLLSAALEKALQKCGHCLTVSFVRESESLSVLAMWRNFSRFSQNITALYDVLLLL